MSTAIFIFRRDLRLQDNIGLKYAIENYDKVIPVFIFTPEQIGSHNKFRSKHAIQFMCESLEELDDELRKYTSRLHTFYGTNMSIIRKICNTVNIDGIIFNMDYTPYARARDDEIRKFCEREEIDCPQVEDYLLGPIGTYCKNDGKPYTVFTPFRDAGVRKGVMKSVSYKIRNLGKIGIKTFGMLDYDVNENLVAQGGRSNGVSDLRRAVRMRNYDNNRDKLTYDTSRLSAHIKFGTVSVREVYHAIKSRTFRSQLFWREFYYYIAYYFPHTLRGKNFSTSFGSIRWRNSESDFKAWCNGKTGFPIVDAGMRELNMTGYMHNRARLITSNFLGRLLSIDWRKGEQYYASRLTDYDPAVNSGNWQWGMSVGISRRPFQQGIFNISRQSKKYDPDAEYIKKWLPQLSNVPVRHLHDWEKYCEEYDLVEIDYFDPIINYEDSRKKNISIYRAAKNKTSDFNKYFGIHSHH